MTRFITVAYYHSHFLTTVTPADKLCSVCKVSYCSFAVDRKASSSSISKFRVRSGKVCLASRSFALGLENLLETLNGSGVRGGKLLKRFGQKKHFSIHSRRELDAFTSTTNFFLTDNYFGTILLQDQKTSQNFEMNEFGDPAKSMGYTKSVGRGSFPVITILNFPFD